jgi:hypothetical protein
MLKYETDRKISDMSASRKEADEIFAVLKVDAENGQFRSAIVSANEKPTGLILKNSKTTSGSSLFAARSRTRQSY